MRPRALLCPLHTLPSMLACMRTMGPAAGAASLATTLLPAFFGEHGVRQPASRSGVLTASKRAHCSAGPVGTAGCLHRAVCGAAVPGHRPARVLPVVCGRHNDGRVRPGVVARGAQVPCRCEAFARHCPRDYRHGMDAVCGRLVEDINLSCGIACRGVRQQSKSTTQRSNRGGLQCHRVNAIVELTARGR